MTDKKKTGLLARFSYVLKEAEVGDKREIQISQNTDSILFGPSLHMDFYQVMLAAS